MNRGANKRTTTALNTATTGLQSSAGDLSRFGDTIAGQANPFLGQAQKSLTSAGTAYDRVGSYLSPILSGSRSAINASLAPDRAAITDTYTGAQNALSGMRGPQRDLALSELNRDRAGKLALLPSQARSAAASGMMQVGQGQTGVGSTQAGTGASLYGQAAGAKGAAAGAYSGLYQGASRAGELQQAYNNQSSSAIGKMIYDAVKSQGKKSGGAGGGAPGLFSGGLPTMIGGQ